MMLNPVVEKIPLFYSYPSGWNETGGVFCKG